MTRPQTDAAPANGPLPRGRGVTQPRSPESLRAEWAAARRRQRQRRALGLPPTDLVDAQPARHHVKTLQAAGMGWKHIADQAGVTRSIVGHLLYGGNGYPPSRRMRRDNADALLAVQPDPARSGVGTRRRLQALVAIGWTSEALADALGQSPGNFTRLLNHDRPVQPTTHRAVCDLYDRLCWALPPQDTADQRRAATKARNRAANKGWPPPLAWDDDTIDDPKAKPAGAGYQPPPTPKSGRTRAVDSAAVTKRAALVHQLTARGRTAREIAAETGLSPRTIHRLRARAS